VRDVVQKRLQGSGEELPDEVATQQDAQDGLRMDLARRLEISCDVCESRGLLSDAGIEVFKSFEPRKRPFVGICGAGIGGCALALALQQRNIPCIIFEKDRSFSERAQGYALTMQQASKTLWRLGFDDVRKIGARPVSHVSLMPGGTVIGEYGRAVHSTTKETLSNGKEGRQRVNVQLPREELRRMLFEALTFDTVRWGMEFDSYECKEAAVIARFRNEEGNTEGLSLDLLVGADGIWSNVRKQKMGPEPPKYLGVVVILGRAVLQHPLTENKMFQTLGGDTRIYTMPFNTENVTMWQLSFKINLEKAKSLSDAGPRALLHEAFRRCENWHDPVPQLLKATKVEDVTGYPAFDRPAPDIDSSTGYINCLDQDRRIVLIGDAMHPMSPFKGQGANQALIDAWSLASKIASEREEFCPVQCFEQEMVMRVKSKVLMSAEAAKELHNPDGISIRASRIQT